MPKKSSSKTASTSPKEMEWLDRYLIQGPLVTTMPLLQMLAMEAQLRTIGELRIFIQKKYGIIALREEDEMKAIPKKAKMSPETEQAVQSIVDKLEELFLRNIQGK